jgi:imidazolonepropionase-like amidohydrolase
MTPKRLLLLTSVCLTLSAGLVLDARQGGMVAAPDRRPTEGRGPFPTLTIRNVMVIDGTGAPPFGPMNVVVENNRIARITSAGTPGVPAPAQPPPAGEVLEAAGMYLMPGFVNLHMHLGDPVKAPRHRRHLRHLRHMGAQGLLAGS